MAWPLIQRHAPSETFIGNPKRCLRGLDSPLLYTMHVRAIHAANPGAQGLGSRTLFSCTDVAVEVLSWLLIEESCYGSTARAI